MKGHHQHQHQHHQPYLQFDAVVKYGDKQTDYIAATRNIIHELKNDLDLILCEVVVVQQMCDIHTEENIKNFEEVFDNTLFAMQLQNIKLEETLKRLGVEKDLEFVKLQLHVIDS